MPLNFANIKKSLRVKLTLFFLIGGLAPIIIGSTFLYHTTKQALFENVFNELQWTTEKLGIVIEGGINEARADLLLASTNPAFKLYYTEPQKKDYWLNEQHKVIRNIRKLYTYLDESCFIEKSGKEVCRIVYDTVANKDELDLDESGRSFFNKTFALEEGEVFTGRPEVSGDTNKWVLPYATPITIDGTHVALFHFELTLNYLQNLLRELVDSERLVGFIINEDGEYLAHTGMEINMTEPLPKAITAQTSPSFKVIVNDMVSSGNDGLHEFSQNGELYYLHHRPVVFIGGNNENKWSVGVIISAQKVYVEAQTLRYMGLVIGFAVLVVILFAYLIGKWVTYPITALVSVVKSIASGNFSKEAAVTTDDEIGELASSFNQMVGAVKKRDAMLKELAMTDGLTGLYNHSHFKKELKKELQRASRYEHPLSLIMADIDDFKNYNDTHGHPDGDLALKMFADLFKKYTREADIAARYGGEEFIIIFPETGAENAYEIAERIRRDIEEHPFPKQEAQPGGNLTASFGVATFPEDGSNLATLLDTVDKRLYMAKAKGKNSVCNG
jgi:diguanylate cyclase (GGDEF)-like protein